MKNPCHAKVENALLPNLKLYLEKGSNALLLSFSPSIMEAHYTLCLMLDHIVTG